MSLFREKLDVFYRKGDDVTVYPVAAPAAAAYLAAGGAGVVVRGLFTEEDVLAYEGDVKVESRQITFETLRSRADAASIARNQSSIEFEDRLYTVIRITHVDPGAVLCWLRDDGEV